MRQLFLSILVVPFLFSCSGDDQTIDDTDSNDSSTVETEIIEEPEIENSFVIASDEVGIFFLGEVVPKLPVGLKSRQGTATLNEGGEIVTLEVTMIFNQLEDVVDLRLEDDDGLHYEDKKIVEMIVHSNYYETKEGIGVGSTIDELVYAYPEAEIIYSNVSGLFLIEVPALHEVHFMLNEHDCNKTPKGKSDREILELIDFNEETKIESIRIY